MGKQNWNGIIITSQIIILQFVNSKQGKFAGTVGWVVFIIAYQIIFIFNKENKMQVKRKISWKNSRQSSFREKNVSTLKN